MQTPNGTFTPQQLGDLAHHYAKEIYQSSENCLMAHSIRAVQTFLEANGEGKHWISITIAKSDRYLGKRAIAIIQAVETEIFVAGGIGFEQQRLGIAHELAHLLLVKLGHTKHIQLPPNVPGLDVKMAIESACGVFEKDLCKRHSVFYSSETNRQRLQFHSLDDYPAPGN